MIFLKFECFEALNFKADKSRLVRTAKYGDLNFLAFIRFCKSALNSADFKKL